MTTQEFAQKIKTKYPQYKNIDDNELAQKIIAKYPQYKSQITQPKKEDPMKQGFFGKFLDTASKFVFPTINTLQTGIMQPIREVQKILPGGKTGTEEYKTPFGTIKDVKSQGAGESALQALDVASMALPVEKLITTPASWIGKFASGTLKRLGGTITGKGVDVIEEIIKNPELAKKGLEGESVTLLKNLANDIRNNAISLSKKASQEYEKALTELPKRLGRAPQILTDKAKTTISVEGKKYVLSKLGAKSYLTEKLRDFGVKVNPAKKAFDFLESPLRKSEENILREVFNVIDKWTDTTPQGFNKLAVKIGNYRKSGEQSETLNAIVGGMKNNIRNYISKRVPAVKELNQAFMKKEDFVDAIRTEFSIPNNLKTTEGTIKTARKVEQLFNSNKELTRELLQEFEQKTGVNILPVEAGRQLSSAPSRAQVSIGDSFRGLVQSVIPPKLIGEIAAQTGIAKQKIESALNASEPLLSLISNYAPAERVAILNVLMNLLFNENQDNQQ